MESKSYFKFYVNCNKVNITIDERFDFFIFKPTLFNLNLHKKSIVLYLFWYLASFFKIRIFYIKDKKTNCIVHHSTIMPKFFQFSFMNYSDYHIMNCQTSLEFRGMGLYSFALSEISKSLSGKVIWVGSRSENTHSIKGIINAGFQEVGLVRKNCLGIYYSFHE